MNYRLSLISLFLIAAVSLAQPRSPMPAGPVVSSVAPARNATDAALSAVVTAQFTTAMDPATLTPSTVFVTGDRSGRHTGTVTYNAASKTVTFGPGTPFVFGETVQATIGNSAVSLPGGTHLSGGCSWKFTTGVIYGTGDFSAPRRTYTSTVSPVAVAAGDFNCDGYTDAAVAGGAGTLQIYVNTQRGTLVSAGTFASGGTGGSIGPAGSTIAIAVADVNGDGATDIVTAHASSNSIGVAYNNGAGKFPTSASFPAGNGLSALSIADMNNDGYPDVAATAATDNAVAVLLNNGAGAFSIAQYVTVCANPSGIALEDFNNDGRIDAAVASRDSNKVTILLNTANTLVADSSYAVGPGPVGVVSFDFDRDGFPDIATANAGSNTLTVYLNDKSGAMVGPGNGPLSSLQPVAMCGNDFDGDGDVDLAITCAGSNNLVIMLNNGFSFPTVMPYATGNGPAGVASIDVSGRYGIMDLVVANSADGTVSLMKNAFFSPPPAELTAAATPLYFPNTPVGGTNTKTVRVYSSITPLQIDSVTSRWGAYASPKTFPLALSSYDSADIAIAFSPKEFGSATDAVTIHSSAGTASVPVNGTSPQPSVTLTQASLAFGNCLRGMEVTRTVTIKNPSINTLTLDSVYTRTALFASAAARASVAGKDSLVLSVSFTPTDYRKYVDTLFILNNSETPRIAIPLSGSSPSPVLTLSAGTLPFGNVKRGETFRKTITLRNDSFNPVTIDSIAFSTRSMYAPSTVPATLPALLRTHDTMTVTVAFTPSAFGIFADTLRIHTPTDIHTVLVAGASPAPALTVPTVHLSFGIVKTRTQTTRLFSVTNESFNSISIDSIVVKNRKQFQAAPYALPWTPAIMKTGDTLKTLISFRPDSARTYSDTLLVCSSSLTEAVNVVLSGIGDIGTGVDRIEAGVPLSFSLGQNYPNPFNPSTTIRFAVPEPSHVSVAIYDITGREIAVVFNGDVGAGFYSAVWNASGVSSGVYLYRLRANDHTDIKRLLLLK